VCGVIRPALKSSGSKKGGCIRDLKRSQNYLGVREGQWMKYFGVEAQQPTMPKIEFSPLESWNSGVRWTISSLSEAPTKASDHTNWGIQYLKDLTKGAFPLALTRLDSF
uniref:MICOS complex subunit MIC13 n=1 Tax=Amphiprion ocellaris TaxID=80972 RepID=A0A3Q1BQQ4_AMPOC